MPKDLDHLLSGHHLLDVGVQLAQIFLLPVPSSYSLAAVTDIEVHPAIAHCHDQGEAPVEEKEESQRAYDLDKTLDQHGEAVVQCIGDGVHNHS